MRTRCPQCDTVFRITPEQLRFRSGKVRCGHCRAVFNAFDSLVEEAPPPSAKPAPPPEEPPAAAPAPRTEAAAQPEAEPEPPPAVEPLAPAEPEAGTAAKVEPTLGAEPLEAPLEKAERPMPTSAETPEQSTDAARAAGLVAARELSESPGYNRWAASPLAGAEAETRHRVTWPFAVVAALLAIALAAQLAYYFRAEIVQRLPAAAGLYTALGADIPLPRQADLVSIEASDLQADNARGLLVLQATLKNRASYAQAWPALELTLTDAHDAAVARRVLAAPDYLPPKADPKAFAADSETAIRLWIETKGIAAVGYRLYVFYP